MPLAITLSNANSPAHQHIKRQSVPVCTRNVELVDTTGAIDRTAKNSCEQRHPCERIRKYTTQKRCVYIVYLYIHRIIHFYDIAKTGLRNRPVDTKNKL